MIFVRVNYLPPESAVMRAVHGDRGAWNLQARLLADLFQAFTGTPHPQLEQLHRELLDEEEAPKRAAVITRARQRADKRRRKIAAGEIT